MAGKSLLDESMLKIGSKDGGKRAKGAGGGEGLAALKNNPRALIAGGIIVVAIGWLGYYYGIGPMMERSRVKNMAPPPTPEQEAEIQRQIKAAEERAKEPGVTTGGA